MGPCAGGDVYSPAMTDFIFMVRDRSYMFVTGPDVVKTVTNEVVTAEELGGAKVHTTKSSIADGAYDNDVEALLQIRRLMDFLPSNNLDGVPEIPSFDDPDRGDDSLDTLDPRQSEQALRHEGADPEGRRRGRLLRDPGILREEHRHRLRAHRGTHGRASSRTSRWCLRACSIPTPPARRPASCASATPSRSRSSPSSTCRASCRARRRNMAGSSSTAPSCCSPIRRRRCRSSP